MSLTDPVADLLTRIRNAQAARLRFVDCRFSALKVNIVHILREQGFVENLLVDEERGVMRTFLKYSKAREPVIQELKRISRPGVRRYLGFHKIPRVRNGLGVAVISTSKGVLDGETARRERLGGELICLVW